MHGVLVSIRGTAALALAMLCLASFGDGIPRRGVTWQWCFKDPGLEFCLAAVDAMAADGYNLIMPEFGPVLQNDILPSRRATFSREDFRCFLRQAKKRGLEVIPMLNTLGHAERALPWPKPLDEGLDMGADENYQALFAVLDGYLEDIAACGLELKFLHLGCDEAGGTLQANSDKYGISPAELLKGHILKLRDYCMAHGLRLIILHDLLMSSQDPLYDNDMHYPDADSTGCWQCRHDLPRDIIVNYWTYAPRDHHYGVADGLRKEGFEVWLTPWGRANMQAMVRQAAEEDFPAVVVSTWMESGGAELPGPNHIVKQPWMLESLAEGAFCTSNPEHCMDEPAEDPILHAINLFYLPKDIVLRPLPKEGNFRKLLDGRALPDYIDHHVGKNPCLLGKWPTGTDNFAELTPPFAAVLENGKEISIDAANCVRGEDKLVVYTSAFGPSTKCNGFGTEAIVDASGTVRFKTEWGVGDSRIPDGGFVLSAHSRGVASLNPLTVGSRVRLRDSKGIFFHADEINGGLESIAFPVAGSLETIAFQWTLARTVALDGATLGEVRLEYEDDSCAVVDIAYGRDIACWMEPVFFWGKRKEMNVWYSLQESCGRNTGRAFTVWNWKNPHPERSVRSVIVKLTPAGQAAGLLITAWAAQ